MDADVVYVLRSGCRNTALEPPRTVLAAALQALTVLAEERLLREIERFGEVVRLEAIPPPSILAASPINFGSTGQLIEAAEETATHWLDGQHRRPAARVIPLRRMAGRRRPLSTDAVALETALSCPDGLSHPGHDVVLLVHGTAVTAAQTWPDSLGSVLPQAGFDWCMVELPDRALGDIQTARSTWWQR